MRLDDDRASRIFKLIAASHEELARLFGALGDPDRGSEPGAPQDGVEERPITTTDIGACIDAGNAAQKACLEAGGKFESCYAVGRIAEAACLQSLLKAPKEVKDS